jgi:hypothetical protein
MLRGVSLINSKIYHFKLDRGNTVISTIENASSGSLAEISYLVYGVDSDEYHNQLYDKLRKVYATGSSLELDEVSINSFDENYLVQDKKLTKIYPQKGKENFVTLPTFVRNCIHYPENKGDDFGVKLDESIKLLVGYE